MAEIKRRRGDTKPFVFRFWEDKAAGITLDITGFTFTLTVDSKKDPLDDTSKLFSLTGVIVGEAVDGKVKFEPSAANMDQPPNTYYYDLQIVDADGYKDTPILDKFKITQDITKS